jgi:hypothetical protein
MRILVSDGAAIFAELQDKHKEGNGLRKDDVVWFSQRYRSAIQAAATNLKVLCQDDPNWDNAGNIAIAEHMLKVEEIWHLTEILWMNREASEYPGLIYIVIDT